MLAGLYIDNRFKTGEGVEKPPQVESVKVFGAEAKDPAAALKQARAFAEVRGRALRFVEALSILDDVWRQPVG